MPTQGQESCNRQSGSDGKLANGQWNQGRHNASESQQEKRECRRNHQTFAVPYISGAGFPNVEVEWRLARQFDLHRRITAPQLILKSVRPRVKHGDDQLDGAFSGGESH